MIKVTLDNGKEISVELGKSFLDIQKESGIDFRFPIIGAKVNNEQKSLFEKPDSDCNVSFIDATCEEGRRIYRTSLAMLMFKAFNKLFPKGKVAVDHSVMGGVWCTPEIGETFRTSHVQKLKEAMQRLVSRKIPFETTIIDVDSAKRFFKNFNRQDTLRLLSNLPKDAPVEISNCGGYKDCIFTKPVPDSSYLGVFDLVYYPPGFILRFPRAMNPLELSKYEMERQIFKIYSEYKKWVKLLNVTDVSSLNEIVRAGETNDLIRISEAFHEKKIAAIADTITSQKENLRIILVAGPSSSGKTTFAHRLAIQLRVNGMKPVAISVDNYFLNRELTPRDENGDYNFEVIDALDLDLFNEHLTALLSGKEITVPIFDFTKGHRSEEGITMKVNADQPIIIEGIHGLNDRLTESVARENKFKIYISPLTQMRLDCHSRIHTTDTRILRRMVRDNLYRGRNALGTLERWDSVRKGERSYIFPYQEEADIMFNSSLIYEISVLKNFLLEPLNAITNEYPEYSEARRLLDLIQFFDPIGTDEIPPNSILREFIGATIFAKM